jgi:tetrahydromethanopterin S-methyltransferase subunit A
MRVIASSGKRSMLRNVSGEEVEAFRHQGTVIDMIGCEDPDPIIKRIQ